MAEFKRVSLARGLIFFFVSARRGGEESEGVDQRLRGVYVKSS